MAVPRYIFWPFDIGSSRLDRAPTRAKTHITDVLWVGVLAQEEGAELRMAGHLMACELCGETIICLWERVREKADPAAFVQRYSCLETRNVLLRHLGRGAPWPMPPSPTSGSALAARTTSWSQARPCTRWRWTRRQRQPKTEPPAL